MQDLNIDNLAVIYVTTEVDRERINQDPPQAPYEPDNAMAKQDLSDSLKAGASQFDYYKDIVQFSMLWQNTYHHFMYCDDPGLAVLTVDTEWRKLKVFDYEKDLVCQCSNLLNTVFPSTKQGYPIGGGTIAGWKLTSDIWPLLINKTFAAGCILPQSMIVDPRKRYSTVSCLFDVNMIYTQGASPAIRRLPALADTLKYWGFTDVNFQAPGAIKGDICNNPLIAASKVELYLLAMEGVIRQYCGYEMRGDLHPLVKEVHNGREEVVLNR